MNVITHLAPNMLADVITVLGVECRRVNTIDPDTHGEWRGEQDGVRIEAHYDRFDPKPWAIVVKRGLVFESAYGRTLREAVADLAQAVAAKEPDQMRVYRAIKNAAL